MTEDTTLVFLVVLGAAFAFGILVGKGLVNELREGQLKQYHSQRQDEFSLLMKEAREFAASLQKGMLQGREWLADAFAEFVDTRTLDLECWLILKPRPARVASEQVSDLRRRLKATVREMKLLQYQVASYEQYFPFLADYRDAILDESIDLRHSARESLDSADPALSRGYLSRDEYDRLSVADKFQLALDRYWKKEKSRWEIGRVYERFVGYLYEVDGWRVTYEGILKGYEDFGRDLICERDGEVHIVQCKCWSQDKVIREKHIFQLYGTSVMYQLRKGTQVTPVFATTTPLSDDATGVAAHLGVSIRPESLRRYPMIKCNINPSTKERIYHLPFDQQYDNIVIGNVEGEFYAESVNEAEKAGYRRAFRWRGEEEKAET